ncbi:MAG: hypothetical protein R2806_08605 [Saprospiraceae bacterium]
MKSVTNRQYGMIHKLIQSLQPFLILAQEKEGKIIVPVMPTVKTP